MRARKHNLVGRRIVDVEWHRFARSPEISPKLDGTQPVLVLDNGTRVWFVVQESEVGEYGVALCITKGARP